MLITREADEIVVRIKVNGNRSNPYDPEEDSEYCAVAGLANDDGCSLVQMIDMAYKDKGDQVGSTLVNIGYDVAELERLCRELKIPCYVETEVKAL
jgi:hypothetical protein